MYASQDSALIFDSIFRWFCPGTNFTAKHWRKSDDSPIHVEFARPLHLFWLQKREDRTKTLICLRISLSSSPFFLSCGPEYIELSEHSRLYLPIFIFARVDEDSRSRKVTFTSDIEGVYHPHTICRYLLFTFSSTCFTYNQFWSLWYSLMAFSVYDLSLFLMISSFNAKNLDYLLLTRQNLLW